MKKILIKNGCLLSPIDGYERTKKDIYIEDGIIRKIDDEICVEDVQIVDASGYLVTPGFIDIHTHCYPNSMIGLNPDILGIERGVTTILDAGSSGAYNYEDFKANFIDKAKTKVFTLLNVSKEGLAYPHELNDLSKIDESALANIIQKYPENIVGLKARASQSVVGEMGLLPIKIAAGLAAKYKLPLTVHVGNYPPALKDVLNLLGENDICTHAFHGKKGGILEKNHIIHEAKIARTRNVKFDIGHGSASFSFKVFQKALDCGFDTDLISTDLHVDNYEGPVYDLASVMTKMINCGETLEDTITKVTSAPARHFKLKGLGQLKEGYVGDISILQLKDREFEVVDSIGDSLQCNSELKVVLVIMSRGNESEIFRYSII